MASDVPSGSLIDRLPSGVVAVGRLPAGVTRKARPLERSAEWPLPVLISRSFAAGDTFVTSTPTRPAVLAHRPPRRLRPTRRPRPPANQHAPDRRALGRHPACRRLAVHGDRPRLRAFARPARRRTPQPARARDRRARSGRQDRSPARMDRQRAAAPRDTSGSTATRTAIPSLGSSFMATRAKRASPTARAKKTSWRAGLRAQRARALERPIPRRRHRPATHHRAPDHRRGPPAALAAVARACQAARRLPLHPC